VRFLSRAARGAAARNRSEQLARRGGDPILKEIRGNPRDPRPVKT
jgi:hypothetical protein